MSDMSERLDELQASGETIAELARQPELFIAAAEAFRADSPERFQAALSKAGLLGRCHYVCRWFCSKHCVLVCARLAGDIAPEREFDVKEWLAFAEFTGKLAADPDTLTRLLEIVEKEDVDAFRTFVKQYNIPHFAHQLCHWLCAVRCRVACRRFCPPLPELTRVGYISVGHLDGQGYAAGPSSPPTFTGSDNPAAGMGDHPFGGSVHLNGMFNVVGATEYKVEVGPSASGPWTAVTPGVGDARIVYTPLPVWQDYTRSPVGDWYAVSDMGLLSEGQTYLTDWATDPADRDVTRFARLVVRNAALVEFPGNAVPVRVDNGVPYGPGGPPQRPLIEFSQGDKPLDCCAEVLKDNGPVQIHIEGVDENFSSLSVVAYGGCSGSVSIYSKTYNGNRADTGAPAPGVTVTWDPWADGVEPCCYVVFVRMYDRAVVDNMASGAHHVENWRSITVT
ncbi:MAG: hypothetical protein IPL45_11430 [Actinomycetales bacterium]|nr:hypothetical protein [Actinomycetales bacterium]